MKKVVCMEVAVDMEDVVRMEVAVYMKKVVCMEVDVDMEDVVRM